MFGDAMSIFARSTSAPSANSPARIRAKRSRFSSTGASRYGLSFPGSVSVPAIRAHLLGGQAVDVGQALRDEMHRVGVELLEVVGGEVRLVVPGEAQPADVFLNRVDVLDVFLGRIRVVEAQVAGAAELLRDAEVQADRLGVADVQVAVRLRRKPRRRPGRHACRPCRSSPTMARMKSVRRGVRLAVALGGRVLHDS